MGKNNFNLLIFGLFSCACHTDNKTKIEENIENSIMNYNNYFEIEQKGKVYKIFILNEQQVENVFKIDNPVKLQNLIFSETSLDVYKIEEGVIAIRQGENEFPLYPSEEILINQLISGHTSKAKDILEGINIYGEDFPKEAKHLAKDFLERIHVDYNRGTSIDILKAVDKQINLSRNKIFFQENLLSFISVVGELINKDYKSNWMVVKSKISETWTPALSYKEQNIFFVDYILIDFDNQNQQSPLLNTYLSITDIMKVNIQ